MTFGQLNSFLAVARTGSVRAAAAALVVTEPAVSAAVTALQRDLGVELLTRRGRGVALTLAGETLARYAAELLALRDQAVSELHGGRWLRLAAVTTAGEYLLPALLKGFRVERPDIEVSLDVDNREHVMERLARREVDVAIGGRPPSGAGITGAPLLRYRLMVVSAAGRPVGDLSDETWLLREPGSGTRIAVEAYLEEHGIAPRATMTLGSNGAIRQAVAVGLGVSLMSNHAAGPDLATGAIRRVDAPGTPLRRTWFVLRRDSGPESAPASAFRAFCTSHDARLALLASLRPSLLAGRV
jgi:DNA-binding transcriptional LysR family regulator